MQQRPESVARKVVPRWRSLAKTPHQELLTAKTNRSLAPIVDVAGEFEGAWRVERNVEAGAELLATAPLAGVTEEILQAAILLEASRDELAPGVVSLLDWFQDQRASDKKEEVEQSERWLAEIKRLKTVINAAPNNPISYVERARLHSMLGQPHAAERCIRRALSLAPDNRFVVRAAARFFVGQDMPDVALRTLGDNRDDPWIVASRVAVSELAERPFSDGRKARGMIEDGDPAQVSELASAMATLDLSEGDGTKRAKKLFRKSAEAPNDNAVAQLCWADDRIGLPFDLALLDTERSFEARAVQAEKSKDWKGAVKNAQLWLEDEPFAKRPALEGCYWSSELLRNYDLAEKFASLGLISHPGDPVFLNNRAFARACLGKIAEAKTDLAAAKAKATNKIDRIVLQATEGCIAFREGDSLRGGTLYRDAVEQAKECKAISTAQQALVHWFFEEFRASNLSAPELLFAVGEFFSDPTRAHEGASDIYRAYFHGIEGANSMAPKASKEITDAIADMPIKLLT